VGFLSFAQENRTTR